MCIRDRLIKLRVYLMQKNLGLSQQYGSNCALNEILVSFLKMNDFTFNYLRGVWFGTWQKEKMIAKMWLFKWKIPFTFFVYCFVLCCSRFILQYIVSQRESLLLHSELYKNFAANYLPVCPLFSMLSVRQRIFFLISFKTVTYY